MLPFDAELEFRPEQEESFFAAIPPRPGVFQIRLRATGPGAAPEPYLARTADLRRASERLLRAPEIASKRLNLRAVAAAFSYRAAGSRFEQSFVLYQRARDCFPGRYRGFLRLRPPALLKINLRNAYPRGYITRRLLADGGFHVGPFASRKAAESFANSFLDLFKIRRCQIKIRRDPNFPGCIYSQMKMCLAPCFAGCSQGEYEEEVQRVLAALASGGDSLRGAIEREREMASATMDFERASLLHKKLEKVQGVFRNLPQIVRRVENLNAVVLQAGPGENTVALFPLLQGWLAEPFFLRFDPLSSQPRSAEEILRRHLEGLAPETTAHPAAPPTLAADGQAFRPRRESSSPRDSRAQLAEREEHLWLLARWFYARPREGEILFGETDWPYRRILRACARVLAARPAASQ